MRSAARKRAPALTALVSQLQLLRQGDRERGYPEYHQQYRGESHGHHNQRGAD